MNATGSNAALLNAPVGDLPIFRRATTLFFRQSGIETIGDIVVNTITEFATHLQAYYSRDTIEPIVHPQSTTEQLANEQTTAIAQWLAANKLFFATTTPAKHAT